MSEKSVTERGITERSVIEKGISERGINEKSVTKGDILERGKTKESISIIKYIKEEYLMSDELDNSFNMCSLNIV